VVACRSRLSSCFCSLRSFTGEGFRNFPALPTSFDRSCFPPSAMSSINDDISAMKRKEILEELELADFSAVSLAGLKLAELREQLRAVRLEQRRQEHQHKRAAAASRPA